MADPVFVDNVTPLDAVSMNKLQTRDEKGAVNGYPSLGADGKVPLAQLPPVGGADLSFDGDWVAGTYQDGDVVVYNGIAYMCVGGPTTVAPDPAIWGIAGPASTVGYGTTLPGAPTDGQEAILVDSITNPSYQWRFRYNAGSTSPYKWEFIGGNWSAGASGAGQSNLTLAINTWTDLANNLAGAAIPRSGDYEVNWSCVVQNWAVATAAGYTIAARVACGAAVGNGASFIHPGVGGGGTALQAGATVGLTDRLNGLTAGQPFKIQAFTDKAIANGWGTLSLRFRPVRVQ